MTANGDILPTDVRNAVNALYETFARYSLPPNGSYSSQTTITAADVRALRSLPLRELTGRNLRKYSMKALTTWGDEDEFRHYLPRLFELLAIEAGWTDVSTLLGKLSTGRWRSWPEGEQRAVEQYLAALSRPVIEGKMPFSLAVFALGTSNAEAPLAPLVSAWRTTPGVSAVVQLASLVVLERDSLLRDGVVGRKWSADARRELGALIREDDTRSRFEETLLEIQDPGSIEDVSLALGVLETMPRP